MQFNSILLLVIFGFLSMLLATVMTNSTATTLMVPICMAILPDLKLEVALIVALSSSSALLLVGSSPSNAIVFNTGYLKQKRFHADRNNLWPARAITCNSLGVIDILTCIVYHIRIILPDGWLKLRTPHRVSFVLDIWMRFESIFNIPVFRVAKRTGIDVPFRIYIQHSIPAR